MPIRFRCPSCEGLLSIATRKAGNEIACPKCGEALIVPPNPDPEPAAVVDHEPETVGAGVRGKAPDRRPSRGKHDPDTEPVAPSPSVRAVLNAPPSPTADLPKSKPKSVPDTPLFERSDFEKLLNSDSTKKPVIDATFPAKTDATVSNAPLRSAERLRQGLPVAEDGVYLSRGTAVMIGVLSVILLGLSFAAGFLVGSN